MESSSPPSPVVEVSVSEGLCTLTLQRPQQRNALDLPSLNALQKALKEAVDRDDVRCVLLRATGPSFCAGADLREWAKAEAEGRLETYGWTEAAHALFAQLYALPKPTIAAIQGSALGAGLDLTLCCDMRLAARSATFRAGYTRMAYSPDAGSSWHLPRLMGPEAARRFLFLDEAWSSEQALQSGLIGTLTEDHELDDRARQLGLRLAKGPTFAYGQTKALLLASSQNSLTQQLEAERLAGLLCGRSADASEALSASLEKRPPAFIGK